MNLTARVPTHLPTGTEIPSGGDMKIEGFDDVVGTITRVEVIEEDGRRFLEVEAEIDDASVAAHVFTWRP